MKGDDCTPLCGLHAGGTGTKKRLRTAAAKSSTGRKRPTAGAAAGDFAKPSEEKVDPR